MCLPGSLLAQGFDPSRFTIRTLLEQLFQRWNRSAVSTLLAQRRADGVGHARLAAGVRSAKVDGVRVAVASLLGGTIPPLVESATALLRDVARAGGQRS
jgi:hypothetical protein